MRQVILFVCQCAVWLPVHVLSKLGDCVTGLLGVGQEWAQLWVCVKRSPGGLVLLWLLQTRAQEHTVTYINKYGKYCVHDSMIKKAS